LATAAFVWPSDAFRLRHADQVANLEKNAGAPLSLSNLPHTMLDLAGIRAVGFDPKMSLANTDFEPRKRYFLLNGTLLPER